MITKQDEEKIIEGIANANLISLNINGLLEAAKFYSITLAKNCVSEMSEEKKKEVYDKMVESEAAQKKAQEAAAENPEDGPQVVEESLEAEPAS